MNTARFCLLFFCLTIGQRLTAQAQFSKRYDFNIPGDFFSSILIKQDTFLLIGMSGDTSNNSTEINTNKILSLVSDLEGNERRNYIYNGAFQKAYGTSNGTLIKTLSNEYAICGIDMDSNGLRNAFFIAYDSFLNITAVKEYQYPDSILALDVRNMVQLKDGTYILTGGLQDLSGVGSTYVLKLDSAANPLWWKKYTSQTLSDLYPTIIGLTDTTLLMGCERNNELLDPNTVISQTKFMIIDTGGKLLTQWLDTNDSTFAPYGLLKTTDGGFAYCGQFAIHTHNDYDNPVTAGVITKLDSNFDLQWRKVYDNDTGYIGIGQFYQLRQTNNGSLIAAGTGYNYNTGSQTYEPTGWFVKVSSNGNSIWSRMYRGTPGYLGSSNTNVINDFQLLPTGDIIGCGEADNPHDSPYSQQAWLIRLDSMGCLIPGCDTLTATGLATTLTDGTHTGMALYPNPASNMVYVLIKTDNPNPQLSFNVYNATGTLLTTQQGAEPDITYLLHISNYASGLYFVQVLSDGKVVATSKFIKE